MYKVWDMDLNRENVLLVRLHKNKEEAYKDARYTSMHAHSAGNFISIFVFQGEPLTPVVVKHFAGFRIAELERQVMIKNTVAFEVKRFVQ